MTLTNLTICGSMAEEAKQGSMPYHAELCDANCTNAQIRDYLVNRSLLGLPWQAGSRNLIITQPKRNVLISCYLLASVGRHTLYGGCDSLIIGCISQ